LSADLEHLGLGGARIRQARWNPGGHVLELLLRLAGTESGEVELLLRYRGVQRLEPSLPELAALVEDVTQAVVASRVDVLGGALEHRLELSGGRAITVGFAALEHSETLGSRNAYGEPGPRFQVLSC